MFSIQGNVQNKIDKCPKCNSRNFQGIIQTFNAKGNPITIATCAKCGHTIKQGDNDV